MNFYTNVKVYGNKILYRGIHNGKRVNRRFDYKPTLYVPSEKNADFRDMKGNPLGSVEFDSIRSAKEHIKQFKDIENVTIHGMQRFEYTFIRDHFPANFGWDFNQIRIARIDIEVASENGFPEPDLANEMITAITLKIGEKYIVFGYPDFNPNDQNITYIQCRDENELCIRFMDFWSSDYPDMLTGWNVQTFDLPYLYNRFRRIISEDFANKLSPWKVVMARTVDYGLKSVNTYDIWGIPTLDSIDLYRKYSPDGQRQDSYSLDNISFVELGENKLDYSEYGDLNKLYKNNPQKHLEYNIRDVKLDSDIEKKYGLLNLALTLAYMNRVNYEDIFAQVRMWTVIVDNFLHDRKIALNHKVRNEKQEYSGGFVLDPIRGMHDWVASFDATSLYPSMIMQYNISPDTFVHPSEYTENMKRVIEQSATVEKMLEKKIDTSLLKLEGVALTPNNQLFRTEKQGFLAEIIEHMFDSRVKFKNKQIECEKLMEKAKTPEEKKRLEDEASRFKSLQTSVKLCLNSCYGALGSEYFLLYEIRQAEAVTTAGRLAIQWIARSVNEYFHKITGVQKDYVIASDTDSLYITMDELVKKVIPNTDDVTKVIDFMDKVCNKPLKDVLKNSSNDLLEYTNAFQQKLHMKREVLANRAVWTNKKRYFMNVWNSEGVQYSKPKVKITGLEAIKSSTPVHCRQKIKDLCEVILNQNEAAVWKFIADYREEFNKLDLHQISSPSSVNGLNTYKDDRTIFGYKCPMHVRASLVFNHYIKMMHLDKKYELIKEGTKIRYIMLKTPNPMNSDVIAWESVIPNEFNLGKYVDYQAQFEKAFLKPVELILTAIGWTSERRNKLSNYYS